MRKRILYTLLSLFSVSLLAQKPDLKQDLKPFTKLEVSSGLKVELAYGETPRVEVYGEITNIEIDQDDDELEISRESSFSTSKPDKIVVYFSKLEEISVSSGCAVYTKDRIETENIEIETSSGSATRLEIKAHEISVEVSSGSALKLSGEADELDVESSSGSAFNSTKLKAQNVIAKSSTGSAMKVWATENLNAKASLGGIISYKGNPQTVIEESMGGQVEHSN